MILKALQQESIFLDVNGMIILKEEMPSVSCSISVQ